MFISMCIKTTQYYAAKFLESVSVFIFKMSLLSHHERSKILGMVEAGLPHIDISRRLEIHRHTVRNTVRRFAATGSVADLPRSGRPRETTP